MPAHAPYGLCSIALRTGRTHAERPQRYGRVAGRVGQKLARHRLSMWLKTPTSRGFWVGGARRDRTADLLIANKGSNTDNRQKVRQIQFVLRRLATSDW